MTVIDSYLDTLFSPYPDSPRLRSAREELAAMMEDKLADLQSGGLSEPEALGQVIAEFGSLDEVAPVLGIEQEVHEEHIRDSAVPEPPADPRTQLDTDEVQEYADVIRRTGPVNAAGITTFVLCALPLLLMIAVTAGAAESAQNIASGIGITLVIVLVALGVLLVSRRGIATSALEHGKDIENGDVRLTAQAELWVKDLQRAEHARTSTPRGIAIGLFILCAVPTILTGVMVEDGNLVLFGVCATLLMVGIGVYMTSRAGWADHVSENLLGTEEMDEYEEIAQASPGMGVALAVYWPIVVAIYLAWSFLGAAWHISWLVWPIAGILYGALWMAVSTVHSARKKTNQFS